MDKNEVIVRMKGIDDLIKTLSAVMGRLSLTTQEKMTMEEKEAFVSILLESRKLLFEKYKGEVE